MHVKLRFCACFEHRVPWNSGKYRMWSNLIKLRVKHVRNMIKTYNLQYGFEKVDKTINLLHKLQKKLSGAALVGFI